MIAIDTNILVRIFIDDLDISQVAKSRELVKNAKQVYLTQIVLIEMVWVLQRAYQLKKDQILIVLKEIYENSAFLLENEDQFSEAIAIYKDNNAGFADCMIWASAKKSNIDQIYTFDNKFARLPGVTKL